MSPTVFTTSGFFSGCLGCMAFVESLAREEPGCMNLMTFSHFFFVTLEGLIVTSQFFRVNQHIPATACLPTVLVFFLSNVTNNQALNFHISVPLYIIFRSSTLIGTLLLNVLLLKRRFPLRKYLSVFAVTIGIVLCTLASAKLEVSNQDFSGEHHKQWSVGLLLLITGLLLSAYLPISQEMLFKKHGKHDREAMFKIHLLSLPFFVFMWKDIAKSAEAFSKSSPVTVGSLSLGLPHLWAYLFATAVLQWVCVRFIYRLNAEVDSLTSTLFTTLRKFLSLVISIVWFQNQFTETHWLGAAFVFAGTLGFADIWDRRKDKKE
ncbi:hypothetical protein L596_029911 [Steinernema carpocapsae]|uniref:Sugar phosphate transporter domain-containing protein n=1 Tax=Steinernema carpocapsae TaxID=34508 RepID=A0A4U5LR60_STECR|nr:hypothetical protein L596_029911 [Steinernema carpocapsae]